MVRYGVRVGVLAALVSAGSACAGEGEDSTSSPRSRPTPTGDAGVTGPRGDAGDGTGTSASPACVDGDPNCGLECGRGARVCPPGLYCDAGRCAKSCTAAGAALHCDEAEICAPQGQCVPDPAPDEDCPSTHVDARPVQTTVLLIIDQSGSMTDEFEDGVDRWNALRNFLLDEPDGLIASLQDVVRFGLVLYSAESEPQNGALPRPGSECPLLTTVEPALNNFGAIRDVYSGAEPLDDTPTGDAVNTVLDELDLDGTPDALPERTVFVIATDGEPDQCTELDPQDGQDLAVEAVERAYALGVESFIISVGEGTVSAEHQQDMANAGVGRDDAEYWVAGDDASLRAALLEIVYGQISCEVDLDGVVPEENACEGSVTLNDDPLTCDDPNGWVLLDSGSQIRLQGDACDTLKQGSASLSVDFPCTVEVASVD